MILSNSKISLRQINRLILTAGTGTLMMLLPDVAGSGEAGIAALFVAFGVTLAHLKIVFWLVEKNEFQMERNDSVRMILGLAAIIEFLKCLALSAGLLLAAANTVRTILLPGKSFALVAAVWLAGAVYLACAGTEAMGRFAEAVWLIALIPLVLLLFLCLAHIGKHGGITEGALISGTIIKTNAAGILLRGILYSVIFAPVELLYWCRDKIAWDVPASLPSINSDPAAAGLVQNLSGEDHVGNLECCFPDAAGLIQNLSEEDAVKRKSGERKAAYRKTVYRKNRRAITSAVCIVFLFAILFTAAAVGILGIQGIQATEHSAMAVAAGLDVTGAIVAQKQGIAVLFFLTGMLTASGVLLGQMGAFAEKSMKVISGRSRKWRVKNGRKNHVLSLCLAVLIWCVAAGLYGRFVNPASVGQTAESGNNTGTADSMETAKNSGTSASALTTAAQIEDRAYCTAIGIDLAEEVADKQSESACLFTIEIAQGSDMEASFVTCEADSLAEAAAVFNANSDRELDVSHLQILLFGDSLRESETYKNMLLEFGDASEYYFGGTLLAFTSETANEYMINYEDSYDSEGTAVGIHLKKRFEQGLESEKAALGAVYYRWINHAEEEPAEWIPTLTLSKK